MPCCGEVTKRGRDTTVRCPSTRFRAVTTRAREAPLSVGVVAYSVGFSSRGRRGCCRRYRSRRRRGSGAGSRGARSIARQPASTFTAEVPFSVVSTESSAFDAADISFIKVIAAVLDVLLALEHDIGRVVKMLEQAQPPPAG